MFATLGEEKKKKWKAYVGSLCRAYNGTCNDTTGHSPFYLMFGCHPRLPTYLIVLVRNVGLKGKHKLADKWSETVYVLKSQPD